MNNFRDGWKSLAKRQLIVVCNTYIPIIVITIAVSFLVIWNSTNQLGYYSQKELDSALVNLETQLNKVDDWTRALILKRMNELMLDGRGDAMASYQIVQELGSIYSACDVKGVIYLYDKAEERFYVNYGVDLYSADEIQNLKGELLNGELPAGTDSHWHIYKLNERFFYRTYFEYTNYKLGILLDFNEIFSITDQKENLYFSDDEQVLILNSGTILEETEKKWDELFRGGMLRQPIISRSESLKCSVGLIFTSGQLLGMVPIAYWMPLLMTLACIPGIFFLWRLIQIRTIRPINILRSAMKQLEKKDYDFRIVENDLKETEDFQYLFEAFNQMAEEIKESSEKDKKMYQAQFDNLRLQVNPHMLLNSFNMIYSLAQTQNYLCIQEFSLHLTEYFRYVLKENNHLVPLSKEMAFVENYISIQKIRFPGTFTSVYSIQEAAENALVPPLIIQNFVENAMKYALTPGEVIEVLINIRRENDRLLISICDTGSGFKEEVLEYVQRGEIYVDKMGQKHIGIWNSRRRLEVFYGEKAKITIASLRGDGTRVWIELPYTDADSSREGEEGDSHEAADR